MPIDVSLNDRDIDFISLYRGRWYYAWFDNFTLSEHNISAALQTYYEIIARVKNNEHTHNDIHLLLKLKLIAKKDPSAEWDFPIVIYNGTVINGTGRVLIDHFVHRKPNGKTIVISQLPGSGEQLESLDALKSKIPFDFSMFVFNGQILSFERSGYAFKTKLYELEKENTQLVLDEARNLQPTAESVIGYAFNDSLK